MSTKFTMPILRYSVAELEPVISQQTIETHYGKHLQTYINNLNELAEGSPFANCSLEEIATKAEGALGNNAGQVLNHTLYFEQFTPKQAAKTPKGALASAITFSFGSFSNMQKKFNAAATTLFGSGWCWLCADLNGKLFIKQCLNADVPQRHGLRPILTFDVWEHAYYLDYKNNRAEFINSLWDLIDWNIIEERYEEKELQACCCCK